MATHIRLVEISDATLPRSLLRMIRFTADPFLTFQRTTPVRTVCIDRAAALVHHPKTGRVGQALPELRRVESPVLAARLSASASTTSGLRSSSLPAMADTEARDEIARRSLSVISVISQPAR
jgi:hypothetical protein